jgi:cation/acetate symporter
VAAFARTNLLSTVPESEYAAAPEWFKQWESTKLIKFEDLNGDGRIQYYNDESTDPEVLAKVEAGNWQGNELTIDKDIMVLANPEIAQLPNWVIGLVAAGGLAAALSTAAGLLLVISTAFAHDLVKRTLRPGISEKQELLYARLAAAGAVIIAGHFGVNPPGFVAQVVAFAFGLAASSFFPVIVMGIFYTRMNREGAIAGMLSGIIFTTAYIVYFKFINPTANTAENWLFGISPEGIGGIGMIINFAVAWLVSRFTPPPPESVRHLVQSIRVPRELKSDPE